ncbi:uncharacterized transposon-derived [Paramuricea clavata]|uniref:Uncharacterized transposon-derived n=1 Tax=Paramuricea clavata TaxID=317549 RepID=A0A6S7HJB8_PARCT|nr:uncharacterized transposon-derived [Paramuricea clavata]
MHKKQTQSITLCPPTQISLEKGHWMDHQPVSSVADGGVITFLSPGTEDYVDLARTILVVRAKVTKPDGTDLGAAEKFSVAPAAAVSLVCYGEFENTVHIDSERNVVYDYSG